jgi:DDE superfamily endonuclease
LIDWGTWADVLKIYEEPLSEWAPVVCVDEKPVVLHAKVRDPIPMKPGSVAKHDCEYQRRGTANVFCGIEPKAGVHFTKVTPTRSSLFATFAGCSSSLTVLYQYAFCVQYAEVCVYMYRG